MASSNVMHFHNSNGVPQIEIGVKEFMCVGALPPFDHPHVYLDMGSDTEIVCPYCSTHYKFSAKIAPGASEPAGTVFNPAA